MESESKKTNTQLLKEIQDVADDINKEKEEVENMLQEAKKNIDMKLQVIEFLEKKYFDLVEEVKKNSK